MSVTREKTGLAHRLPHRLPRQWEHTARRSPGLSAVCHALDVVARVGVGGENERKILMCVGYPGEDGTGSSSASPLTTAVKAHHPPLSGSLARLSRAGCGRRVGVSGENESEIEAGGRRRGGDLHILAETR